MVGQARFDDGETACDGPRGVALWFDEASRQWSELPVPKWLSEPSSAWVRRPSELTSLGSSGTTLYLGGYNVVVSLDVESGRFEELYDRAPANIESCRMGQQIIVVSYPAGGVDDGGAEATVIDPRTAELRALETPFAHQDSFTLTCGANPAHLFTSKHRYEFRADTWTEIEDWPRDLEMPMATGSAGGVELAWTDLEDGDHPRWVRLAGDGLRRRHLVEAAESARRGALQLCVSISERGRRRCQGQLEMVSAPPWP